MKICQYKIYRLYPDILLITFLYNNLLIIHVLSKLVYNVQLNMIEYI